MWRWRTRALGAASFVGLLGLGTVSSIGTATPAVVGVLVLLAFSPGLYARVRAAVSAVAKSAPQRGRGSGARRTRGTGPAPA